MRLSAVFVAAIVQYLGVFCGAADSCSTEYPSSIALNLCFGLIDYPFFIPDGFTSSDMESEARSYIESLPNFNLYPRLCLKDLKVLACANAYKKCVDNVDLSDDTTWTTFNYNSATRKLPYIRPSRSLCTATLAGGSSCNGILEGFGAAFDCNAVDATTNYPQYAESPDANNDMSAVASFAVVAEMKEIYNPSGVCNSVVGAEVYLPSPQRISPIFPPVFPPGVLQSILEGSLSGILSSIPVFIAEKCLIASTKLFCGLVFKNPQLDLTLPSPFQNVYMPQYPSKSICENYQTSCLGFILLAASKGKNVSQNCAEVNMGIESFPETAQTLLSVSYNGNTYSLTSLPNNMENAAVEAETLCPDGFVVPENPTKDGVIWIPGTGCALKCPPPLLTDGDYSLINTLVKVYTGITLPCGIFLVLTWSIFKKKRKQPIVLALAIETTIIALVFAIHFMIAPEPEDRFCSDNAVTKHQRDGGYCIFQALVLGYFSMSIACWWLCQSFDVWLKAVKQMKNVDHFFRYYFSFSMLYPLVFHAIPRLAMGLEGYDTGSTYCFNSDEMSLSVELWTMYIPVAVLLLIGIGLMCSVLHAILKSVAGQGSGGSKNLKMFRTPIVFIVMILTNWIIMFTLKFYAVANTAVLKEGFLEWVSCTFGVFDGVDDDHIDICGEIAKKRMPLVVSLIVIVSIYTQCIPLFITYGLSVENYKLWGGYLGILSAQNAKISSTSY